MNNTYYQKYIKYKNKYLELKNQYGGIRLNLYLPSDIYNITKKFMIEVNDYTTKFKNKLGDTNFNKIYHYIIDSNQTFVQDPSIIFNQQDKKYIIRLSKYDYKNKELKDGIFNDDFISNTDILLGGNFISIPPNPHNNLSLIITTKCLNDKDNIELDKLINFIEENIIETQQIININCSFPHLSGGIHIDELLCPMPYKSYELFHGYEINYKIWIYKINSIDFNDFSGEMINEIIINIGKNINHTRFDGYTKQDLQNIITQIDQINTTINSLRFGDPIRKKLRDDSKIIDKNGDNIFFKELNKEEYKILYKLIRENKYEQVKKLYEDLQDIDLFRTNLLEKFNIELEENKRIIGSSIFGELYEENKVHINNNFFVEYPIDLKFKYNIFNVGYSIKLPPIFNRVFIKLEAKNICFLPVKNNPEQLLLDFIQKEQSDMIPIEFEYIDTYEYHIKGGDNADGGNIHCLSKQIFI